MRKILILGPQGSGKGTQAVRLSQKLNIPAISMGELLRDEVASGSELAQTISSYIDQGQLVPDDLALEVLKQRLNKEDAAKGYILDGYPRNLEQYAVFEVYDQPTAVLIIDVPREESVRRLLHRAEVEGRKDDTLEVIKERLRIYHEETEPVIEKYAESGIVYNIDGVGTMEEVEERIDQVLNIQQ